MTARLWFMRRSANGRGTHCGPRMHWLAIASDGPRQVTLVRPWCGRIAFKRSELAVWGLSTTPEDALLVFEERAEHWLAVALEDVRHAERDLAFVEHRTVENAVQYAKEEPES